MPSSPAVANLRDPLHHDTPTPSIGGGDSVAVVEWPAQRDRRAAARSTGRACLLVIARDTPPPADCGVTEDWISADAPAVDREHRVRTLARRVEALRGARQRLAHPVELHDPAAVIHRELIALQGQPVSVSHLRAAFVAAGGATSRTAFDAALRHLRGVLADHGQQLDRLDRGDVLLTVPAR